MVRLLKTCKQLSRVPRDLANRKGHNSDNSQYQRSIPFWIFVFLKKTIPAIFYVSAKYEHTENRSITRFCRLCVPLSLEVYNIYSNSNIQLYSGARSEVLPAVRSRKNREVKPWYPNIVVNLS